MGSHNRASAAVLVVVVSALFLASTFTVSQPGDLITELCSKTSYVETCITTVKENIKGDPTGIAILNAEIDAATKGTIVALTEVEKLTKSASKREKKILSTCKENFQSSVDSLEDAKTAVAERKATLLNVHINAMVTQVTTCDDSYKEASIPSPLIKLDRQLIHLGSNCFVIADLIGLGVA